MRSGWMLGAATLLSALAPLRADFERVSLHHRLAALTSRRGELARRLASIEADSPTPLLLRSPVDIQDHSGNSIVFISRGAFGRGFTVFNERKQGVASVDGSTVMTLSSNGGGGISFGYGHSSGPYLQMWKGPTAIASVTVDGFVAFTPTGKAVAAQLSATQAEAGYLTLGDAAGNGLVEAGMLSNRKNVGVVRVAPYIPRMELLLPITPHRIPNFIRGYRPK